MRSSRLRCCDLAIVLIGLSWLASLASAQTIQSRAASVGAPRSISTAIAARAVPPPNPRQFAAEKQQRINDHFRPTIELVEAAGIRALALPQVPPTAVKAAPVQATTGLRFFTNRGLTDTETSGVTSTVCEPSVAARGQEILVTGNWFAAFSKNGGASFQYVNPDTTFPPAGNGKRFCCDQVAIYDPQHDVMCWYLQYISDATGNTGRLAVARGADIAAQSWRYYDFTPQSVGRWTGEWFDFPDLALSGTHLYVTTNAFSASDEYRRSVVLRLPLADLANYRPLNYRFFDTNQVASIRPAQGATDTMYLAAHRNLSSLRFFSWPDSSLSIGQVDVAVQSWSNATRVAPGPDGKDWLGRADGRITAAAVAGANVAFAWTAAQDSTRRYPYVQVALIDKTTKAVVGQPHLLNRDYAFAYPAFAPNTAGQLGISVHFGGGTLRPSHAVGVLDSTVGFQWKLITSAQGTHGPADNKWGDYQAVRTLGKNWIATGFTLQGGTQQDAIQPTYLHFGFEQPTDGAGGSGGDECLQKLEKARQELKSLREDLQRALDRADRLNEAIRAVTPAAEAPKAGPKAGPKAKPAAKKQPCCS